MTSRRPTTSALVLLTCVALAAGCQRAVGEDPADAGPGPDAGPTLDADADADVDAAPDEDAGLWWYDCFPSGYPLCWRDRALPESLTEAPDSWASTPLLPMGTTDFHVIFTQSVEPEPLPSHIQDATWLGAVELVPPHLWDAHLYVPTAVIHLDTALDGELELAVALDAAGLAFIPVGEPLVLTLFNGLEVARASDGRLLFALVDRMDDADPYTELPPPRVMDSAGLDLSVTPDAYCFGAEGTPLGNRQFAFDTLLVKGGATNQLMIPGDVQQLITSEGTYLVRYIAGWHRTHGTLCAHYADYQPWRISYEVLRIP